MPGRHIVLPGGSGYLGRNLTRRLTERGDRVTVLTRGRPSSGDGWEAVHWDGRTVGPWSEVLEGADAIVHLTGKLVDCRPTKRNIDELIDSRVDPVRTVGEAWRGCTRPPPIWIQLSSLARFGEGGDEVIDERTPPPVDGPRQMVEVCSRWEEAFAKTSSDVPRSVLLRQSIAIGPGDPALRRLGTLARLGLGGKVATGKQWLSWISLEDSLSVIMRAVDSSEMTGLYHVTSPNPIRNEEMMAGYRVAVGRRIGIPSPKTLTIAGAWLIGSDPALALTGRKAIPKRLLDEGFVFSVTSFGEALERAMRS